jgi:hypothetical protein
LLHAAAVAAGSSSDARKPLDAAALASSSLAAFSDALHKWQAARAFFGTRFAARAVATGAPDVPLARAAWLPPFAVDRLAAAAARLLRCLVAAAQDPRAATPALLASTPSSFVDGRGLLQANLDLFELLLALQRDLARRDRRLPGLNATAAMPHYPDHDVMQPLATGRGGWCWPRRARGAVPPGAASLAAEEVDAWSQGACLPPLAPLDGSPEGVAAVLQQDAARASSCGDALVAATLAAYAPTLTTADRRRSANAAARRLAAWGDAAGDSAAAKGRANFLRAFDAPRDAAAAPGSACRKRSLPPAHSRPPARVAAAGAQPAAPSSLAVVAAVGVGRGVVVAWAPCGLLHVARTGATAGRQVFSLAAASDRSGAAAPPWASHSWASLDDEQRAAALDAGASTTSNSGPRSLKGCFGSFGALQGFAAYLERVSLASRAAAVVRRPVHAGAFFDASRSSDDSPVVLLVGLLPLLGLPLALLAPSSIPTLRATSLAAAAAALAAAARRPLSPWPEAVLRLAPPPRSSPLKPPGHERAVVAAALDAAFPRVSASAGGDASYWQYEPGDDADGRDRSPGRSSPLTPRVTPRTPRGGWRIAAAPAPPRAVPAHGPLEQRNVPGRPAHLCAAAAAASLALPLLSDAGPWPVGFSAAEVPGVAAAETTRGDGPHAMLRRRSSGCVVLAPVADLVHLPDTVAAFLSAPTDLSGSRAAPAAVAFCPAPAARALAAALTAEVSLFGHGRFCRELTF